VQSQRDAPWSGGVDADDCCDDGILPVFCPTCQTKIAKRAILVRANRRSCKSLISQASATVHGVVFAFFVSNRLRPAARRNAGLQTRLRNPARPLIMIRECAATCKSGENFWGENECNERFACWRSSPDCA
jgi:hypothetical protein